jgi:hypothetical protein
MVKYYDCKINDNADHIIWVKQKDDGTIKIIAISAERNSRRTMRVPSGT